MKDAFIVGSIMTFLGIISGLIGGAFGTLFHVKNKNVISALYELTAGIMTGIVCFEMLPESFLISNIIY